MEKKKLDNPIPNEWGWEWERKFNPSLDIPAIAEGLKTVLGKEEKECFCLQNMAKSA